MKGKKIIIILTAIVLFIVGIIIGMKYAEYHSEKTVAEQLELGERYLLEQDYEAAVVAFSKVIEADPKCVDAYLKVSDAYIGLGDYDSAIEQLEKGYAETGDESIHQALLDRMMELGEQYLTKQDYKAAAAAFSKVIQADPKCVDAYLKVADAYIGFGDYDSAIEQLERGYAETGEERLHQKLLEIRPEISEESTKLLQGLCRLMQEENCDGAIDYMEEHATELADVYCNQMGNKFALFDGNQFRGKIDGTGLVFKAHEEGDLEEEGLVFGTVQAFWGEFKDGAPHGKNTECRLGYSEDLGARRTSEEYFLGTWENGKVNGEGYYEERNKYNIARYKKILEGTFQQDIFTGRKTCIEDSFFETSDIMYCVTVKNGQETADGAVYDKDGNLDIEKSAHKEDYFVDIFPEDEVRRNPWKGFLEETDRYYDEEETAEPATELSVGELEETVSEFSNEELEELTMYYYIKYHDYDYKPQWSGIVHELDNNQIQVLIHLYDDMGTHTATSDWYTVSREDATGYDILDNSIDLKEAILYRAFSIYYDFVFGSVASEVDENVSDEFGYYMQEVSLGDKKTYSEILEYLRTIYSDEIIDNMTSNYEVSNGKMYRYLADRGADITVIDWTCSAIRQSGNERTFTVTIWRDDDADGISDRKEKVEFKQKFFNGKWIFTEFPFFL